MSENTGKSDASSQDRASLLALLQARKENTTPRVTLTGPQPLSFAQERMWLLDRIEPDTALYNIPYTWRLRGRVNPETMRSAVTDVLQRHGALRVKITESVTGIEQLLMDVPAAFELLEYGHLDEPEARAGAMTFIRSVADRPFDLSQPPFLRVALATINAQESLLLIVVHHIAADGWSMGILARDLSLAYAARLNKQAPDWEPLEQTYLDYAVGQRQRLRGPVLGKLLDFWTRKLEGLVPITLPCDFDRPHYGLQSADQIAYELPPGVVQSMRAITKVCGATEFMTTLAALHVLLFRLGAEPDHAVGVPAAGRFRMSDEKVVGFFVNTLVMRTQLAATMTFRELLVQTRTGVVGAIDHQELPFEKLVCELNPERQPGTNPLFQVGFAFQNMPGHALELPGVAAERLARETSIAKFDLQFYLFPEGGDVHGRLDYSTALLTRESAQWIVRAFVNVLSAACSSPDQPIYTLNLMDASQLRVMRDGGNAQRREYPRTKTLDQLFKAQVAGKPDAIALEHGSQQITYAALDLRARIMRDQLCSAGIQRGARVGVLLDRSVDMIAAFLAILETGAVWVPLDPAFPQARLQFIAEDADIAAVFTRAALDSLAKQLAPAVIHADTGITVQSKQLLPSRPGERNAADTAAIFYTSGSTGTPKGVAVTHQNIVQLVYGQDYIPFGPERRFLLHSPASFDAFTFELWGALLHGAVCVIAPDDIIEMPVLAKTLADHRIDTLFLTTSLFNLVIDDATQALAGVRWLLTGGEAMSVTHIHRAQRALPDTTLMNVYGPTETTTFACSYVIPRDLPPNCRSIPIGRPLANTTCFVVDSHGQLCAPGVEGELLIGGDGLTAGYLDRPELQEQKFIRLDAAEGARVYRTGDRVRWLHDGTLEFRGRIDDQIKLRGFRIEPGEIAAALLENPAIGQATVILREDQPGARQLVAYATGTNLEVQQELERLRRRLPAYMIPASLVFLDTLPLGPNGKIDRGRLPIPEETAGTHGIAAPRLGARNDTERLLVEIWSELFDGQDIGIHDNFFALGGHSLLASRACLRIGRQFGVDLRMSALFAGPTIAQLAEHLGTLGRSQALVMQYATTVAVVRPSRHGDYVLCVGGRIAELLQTLPDEIGILFLGSGDAAPADFHRKGINRIVDAYAAEIAKITPLRMLVVSGFSYGGLVAYALTARLRQNPVVVSADAVLLEPSIRTGPRWEAPPFLRRLSGFIARVSREGPSAIRQAVVNRLRDADPPDQTPAREPTEGERAWLLVGPHMHRNVRRFSPPTTPSRGIHLVVGENWMRSRYPAFKSLCTPQPDVHAVGQIGHHDLVDDPRCIAVWRDLIGRLFV